MSHRRDEPPQLPNGHQPLMIAIDGFDGPLDLLLHLSRQQKVDLMQISIKALVDQYLLFVQTMEKRELELAADYLVMAAWLAYLKSRLLLPNRLTSDDHPTAEGLAEVLQFRLRRLEAMRNAARGLVGRDQLGVNIFTRGEPELSALGKKHDYTTSLFELLIAYATIRQRTAATSVTIKKRSVWPLSAARRLLQRLLSPDAWIKFDEYIAELNPSPKERTTATASSFAASLELVREGRLQMQQTEPFGPMFLRLNSR